MIENSSVLIIITIFLVAGLVKGVIGLGLPTVSLALLTVAIDLPTAMALLLIPSFVTNIWQAFSGGNGKVILARIWPFLLMATITIWLGATALTRVNLSLLSILLGVLLIAYSATNLGGIQIMLKPRHETWVGLLAGLVNGVLTGMTGSFVVPGVMFLQATKLSRDMLIQAMGMLFTLSTVSLALTLERNNLLTIEQGTTSLIALLPAIAGMILGQRLRKKLPEQTFKKVFFISLLILGLYIVANKLATVT